VYGLKKPAWLLNAKAITAPMMHRSKITRSNTPNYNAYKSIIKIHLHQYTS